MRRNQQRRLEGIVREVGGKPEGCDILEAE